jgi:hypothetical protein
MSLPNEGIQEGGLANGHPEARYWRRPKVTPPNVRRAAIVKKRSAKFPYRLPCKGEIDPESANTGNRTYSTRGAKTARRNMR